jgi:DNA-binding transcriptional regulator YiaG
MTHSLDAVTTTSTSSGASALAPYVLAAACFLWSPPIASATSSSGSRWDPTADGAKLRMLSSTSSAIGDPLFAAEPSADDGSAAVSARTAIVELRRISGLTWEQIAAAICVSRRSLHLWASGKPMLPGNEERLQRVLGVVRAVDRGSAAKTRQLLLSAAPGSELALDLLASGQYEAVIDLLGRGPGAKPVKRVVLSHEARSRRRPQPVGERAESTSEQAHRDVGEPRRVRITRDR